MSKKALKSSAAKIRKMIKSDSITYLKGNVALAVEDTLGMIGEPTITLQEVQEEAKRAIEMLQNIKAQFDLDVLNLQQALNEISSVASE